MLGHLSMTRLQHRLSFVVMVILIFVAENLLAYSWISTGPHVYVDFAFGWLQIHRYGSAWSIEHFNFRMLIVAVLSSVLLAWIVSKALRHRLRL